MIDLGVRSVRRVAAGLRVVRVEPARGINFRRCRCAAEASRENAATDRCRAQNLSPIGRATSSLILLLGAERNAPPKFEILAKFALIAMLLERQWSRGTACALSAHPTRGRCVGRPAQRWHLPAGTTASIRAVASAPEIKVVMLPVRAGKVSHNLLSRNRRLSANCAMREAFDPRPKCFHVE
jgi:hypothetical protein